MRTILAFSFCCFYLIGCQSPQNKLPISALDFQAVQTPVSGKSEFPQLFSTEDRLYMSWLEEREDSSFLKLTFLEDGKWRDEQVVAKGKDWFVNWADFPEVFIDRKGTMLMHHLAKTGKGTYAYGVEVSQKSTEQTDFVPLGNPYTDTSETEHGFVSFFSVEKEGNAMIWLDGRKYASGNKEMSLRTAKIGGDGKFYEEREIDGRTCDCCQTDAVMTKSGAVVVYRDRSEGEIRDIYSSVYKNGSWSAPKAVAEDRWEINGCPVNGPALASMEDKVAVAWFTAAHDTARVKVAFSSDGGETFQAPIHVDLGNPMGRVDLIWKNEEEVLLSWMERSEEKKADVMIRTVQINGKMGPPQTVGEMSGSRATGFPIIAQHKGAIYMAWTLDKEVPEIALWKAE